MRFSASPVRLLSLLVLVAVTNVYVLANGTLASPGKNAGTLLLGKLITNSDRSILVNGGEAITGTVILSGAQLITPTAGGATVQLEKLGAVMIAPSSSVTLTFDLKNVVVTVTSGDAALSTVDGVKGVVIRADGTPADAGPNAPAPAPAGGSGGGGFDKGDIAGVALGGLGLVIGIIALNRANNARDADAALRACLAGQTASPVRLCTSF